MSPRKYKPSAEMVFRWVERYRRGDSFSKIGLDEGVERRVVARVVREFKTEQYVNAGAATLRDVRAGFLREHLENLEMGAQRLLEVTAAPSLQDSMCVSYFKTEAELLQRINEEIEKTLLFQHKGLTWLPSDNKAEETQRRVKLQVAERMLKRKAKAVVEDLKEHLPGLWSRVEEWESAAANYEDIWRELAKQAESKGIAQDLFEPGLRAGLHLLSEFEQKGDLPRVPLKLGTASDVGVWLFRNGATRDSLESFRQNLEELEATYARLGDKLNSIELRKALLERQCKHCPLP